MVARRCLIAALMIALGLLPWPMAGRATDLANMTPEALTTLQKRLTDAGCYHGPVNGFADPATAAAMEACPDQNPVLRLETGMHVTGIKRLGVDAACRLAATASDDKTVRLWSLPDGRPLRVLRWPIGAGNAGKVFATAVSPDGRFVAAGGWNADYNITQAASLTIFDAGSGAVVARVGGFENGVNHLAFSPDGHWLAAALGSTGVRIIETSSWRVAAADRAYGDQSIGATFAPDGRLYTTALDGRLRQYGSGPGFVREAAIATHGGKRPYAVAVDPSGTRLAVGFGDRPAVDLYDVPSLRYRGRADTRGLGSGDLGRVAWRSDGRALIAGGGYADESDRRIAFLFDRDGRRLGPPLPLAADTIQDVQPCGAGFAFAASDPAIGLLRADGSLAVRRNGVMADMRKTVGNAFLLSPEGKRLQFRLGFGDKQPVIFDLAAAILAASPTPPADLAPPKVRGLPVTDWQNTFQPLFAGMPIAQKQNEMSHSLAIRPGNAGFVLGTEFSLRAFDAQGQPLWRQSVPSVAWGVNISGDGRLVVAAYGDGTIRWHRWSDGQELLALFVNRQTKTWVAWTPSGYYMASPGAEDLIGWHINRGWTQAAEFFPASRFRDRFDRPDIVETVLDTLDESEAIRQADAASHKRQDTQLLIAKLPPVIRITSPLSGTFGAGDVTISYALRSPSGQMIDRIDVLVDGVRQQDRGFNRLDQPGQGEVTGSLVAHLPQHDVEVALVAHAGDLAGEPARVRLAYAGAAQAGADLLKPKLYALVVGVSDYADASLKLGYADKDAEAFASALKAQSGDGGLYGAVEATVITDKSATRVALLKGLKWLGRQVTSRDVGVVYLAGHGVADARQEYWFLPSDATPEDLDVSAVSQDEIHRALDGLAGKAVLFLDSCHAGQIEAGVKRRGTLDINKVVGDFASADNGVVVFAASMGREVSQERDTWGHGAFTKALIEGLSGKADVLHHGTITLAALDFYIADRVKELTGGDQHPVMTKPSTVPDYPIAIVPH